MLHPPQHVVWRRILQLIIVLYPFIWVWQGLDFTDTGFAMTNYHLIFQAPETIYYWGFNYWLTDVVGGVWLLVFGKLGLFGIRLAASVLILFTCLIVYRLYRGWMSDFALLIAIVFGEAFIERMYWLNYDNLSAFLFTLGGFLMVRGLVKRNTALMYWSGFVLGLNFFARLTNVAGLVAVLAIFLTGLAARSHKTKQLNQTLSWIFGIVTSVTIVMICMAGLGHLQLFLHNASTLFSIAGGHQNTHSGNKLLRNFWHDETVALRTLCWTFAFMIWLTLGNAYLSRKPFRLNRSTDVAQVVFTALSILVVSWFSLKFVMNRYYMVAALTGILYGVLVYYISVGIRRRDVTAVSTSAVALCTLFAAPLGSDLGIRLAVYGMYLALPIAMKLVIDSVLRSNTFLQLGWTRISLKTSVVMVLTALFTDALLTCYHYTYRDASARLTMRFPVDSPKLQYTYTTKERADVVNSLIRVLPIYVHPGDDLLAYEETSLIYYVTDTRPYLNTSWPMLYSPEQLQTALIAAERTHKKLPVAVRATGATADFRWPLVHHMRTGYPHDKDRRLMDVFLKEHHYHMAWENTFFQILVPDKSTSFLVADDSCTVLATDTDADF